jgi:acetyl-CoA carboxylase alpha subunit
MARKRKGKVEKVMGEHKRGTLRSGSGGKVRSRKQAIAIGLSEARKAGEKVARRRGNPEPAGTRRAAAVRGAAERAGKSGALRRRLTDVPL